MLIAAGLGLAFGLLLTRASAKIEGPIADIDNGLARQEFKPFYQPTFDLRTGAVRGCEVLVSALAAATPKPMTSVIAPIRLADLPLVRPL
jgi:sensor c-di-GMP phosphodiesterase-like protein